MSDITMCFITFLLVLSPLAIPVAVTLVDTLGPTRRRREAKPARQPMPIPAPQLIVVTGGEPTESGLSEIPRARRPRRLAHA